MSYYNELSFASGYYTIRPGGQLVLFANIPEDIEKKVRALWPDLRRRCLERQAQGLYSSRYPVITPGAPSEIIKRTE